MRFVYIYDGNEHRLLKSEASVESIRDLCQERAWDCMLILSSNDPYISFLPDSTDAPLAFYELEDLA